MYTHEHKSLYSRDPNGAVLCTLGLPPEWGGGYIITPHVEMQTELWYRFDLFGSHQQSVTQNRQYISGTHDWFQCMQVPAT